MKKLFLQLFFLFTGIAFAQETGAVTGTILDAEMGGEPMIMAHVVVKNTRWAGETNFHGNFEFNSLKQGAYLLVVSYPGYRQLEIPVVIEQHTTAVVNGTMQPNEILLGNADVLRQVGVQNGNGDSKESISLEQRLPGEYIR